MSENEDIITSVYPPPPVYYKYFTDENVEELGRMKKERTKTEEANPEENKDSDGDVDMKEDVDNTVEREIEIKDESLPHHLRFLEPPTRPEGTSYRNFGNIWQFDDKLPTLNEMNVRQLYKDEESNSTAKISELKKLLKSLLLNFLELIGTMSVSPEQFGTKLENIHIILINIHHLLNQYRPHQSRESLMLLLQKQIDLKNNEISKIEKTCLEVENKIKSLTETYIDKMRIEHEAEELPTVVKLGETVGNSSETTRLNAIDEMLNELDA